MSNKILSGWLQFTGASLLSVMLSVMLSMTVRADTGEAEQGSGQALIALLQAFASMSGEFTQRQTDSAGELLAESSGIFSVRRPGFLRWETLQPFPQLLVSNGETLWLYDPDLEQVSISAVDEQLNQTPAVIFSGDLQAIQNQYHITRDEDGSFSLTPRQQEGQLQRLDLTFDKQRLVGMSILDGFGQLTDFRFRAVDYDRQIPLAEFQFTPPAGTDILQHE